MTIRTERPPKNYSPMNIGDRAKQFAPYAALGSMEPVLRAIIEGRNVGDFEHVENLEDFNFPADDAETLENFDFPGR